MKILAQTNFEPLIEEALENGADVTVAMTHSRDKLIESITSLCSDSVGAVEPQRTSPISSRELQILHLIAGGQTDQAIAQALQDIAEHRQASCGQHLRKARSQRPSVGSAEGKRGEPAVVV